jgi:hypothetical protein
VVVAWCSQNFEVRDPSECLGGKPLAPGQTFWPMGLRAWSPTTSIGLLRPHQDFHNFTGTPTTSLNFTGTLTTSYNFPGTPTTFPGLPQPLQDFSNLLQFHRDSHNLSRSPTTSPGLPQLDWDSHNLLQFHRDSHNLSRTSTTSPGVSESGIPLIDEFSLLNLY